MFSPNNRITSKDISHINTRSLWLANSKPFQHYQPSKPEPLTQPSMNIIVLSIIVFSFSYHATSYYLQASNTDFKNSNNVIL